MLQDHIMQDQSEVINFLREPSSYPHSPDTVQTTETHGAIVFLAGDQAYKVKKAVRFNYLDFSTLAQREMIIKHEVELNKINAPSIYLDAVPITRDSSGALALGGEGEAVEWAVHMKRFNEADVLVSLAKSDLITNEIIDDLARSVASYHSGAKIAHDLDGSQIMSDLIDHLEEAFDEAPEIFSETGKIFARSARELSEHVADCLRYRSKRGYVRRCHGDMHLRNIVMIDQKPVLFDAIEFDEKIATVDIFYDLAFLLMDLTHRGLKYAANRTLNRYFTHSYTEPNLVGLKAMPLFLSCRAAVRAMVTAQQAVQSDSKDFERLKNKALNYLGSAMDYLDPPAPRLIAVGGLSGTGKSTLASALAPAVGAAPGALHLRSDIERKLMFEMTEQDRLPPELYAPIINGKVYDNLLSKAATALQAGHSVIVDAVFSEEERRAEVQELARSMGVSFKGLWLTAPKETLLQRVDCRKNDASDADQNVVSRQVEKDVGVMDWSEVDAGGSQTDTAIEASHLLAS